MRCRQRRTGTGRRRERDLRVEQAAVVVGGAVVEEEEVLVPDQAVAEPELEGEADRPVQDATEAGVEDALHEDVDGFPGSENPASRAMKPACMKNTRNAATSTHMVFTGLMKSSALWATVCTVDAPAGSPPTSHAAPFMIPSTLAMPSILPLSKIANSLRVSFSLKRRSRDVVMRRNVGSRHYVGIRPTLRTDFRHARSYTSSGRTNR